MIKKISPDVLSDIRDIVLGEVEGEAQKVLRFKIGDLQVIDPENSLVCEIKEGARPVLVHIAQPARPKVYSVDWDPVAEFGPSLTRAFSQDWK